jgi:hypothetical protein
MRFRKCGAALASLKLPSSPFDGTVLFSIFVQFQIREGGVDREWSFRSFQTKCGLQFLIAKARGVLVGDSFLDKCLV